jgi:staphylococcal nuclease domain-containing protein 1
LIATVEYLLGLLTEVGFLVVSAAVIENVSNGTTVRARLLLNPSQHQFVTVTMAGVRSPRSRQYSPQNQADSSTSANEGEPFGDEAKFFTECRLLQRSVSVVLISLPTPQATSLTSQAQAQQSLVVSSFIGIVQHPAGSIAALLLANGLARVVDWHAGFLSSVPEHQGGGMERLRKAEAEGKAARRGHWKSVAAPASDPSAPNGSTGASAPGKMKFDGIVSRVWTGDTVSIRLNSANKSDGQEERKVQLSSIRQPRYIISMIYSANI